MIHWFLHVTGIDTQQSPYYDFWSGIATQATVILSALGLYRHNNCHKRWCPRLGHKAPDGHFPVCRKHRESE